MADLDGVEKIKARHVAEAIQYRQRGECKPGFGIHKRQREHAEDTGGCT